MIPRRGTSEAGSGNRRRRYHQARLVVEAARDAEAGATDVSLGSGHDGRPDPQPTPLNTAHHYGDNDRPPIGPGVAEGTFIPDIRSGFRRSGDMPPEDAA